MSSIVYVLFVTISICDISVCALTTFGRSNGRETINVKSSVNATMARNLPKTMKAVGLYKYLPITYPNSLEDVEVEIPQLLKKDVLIQVKAVGVNPIDAKIRAPKDIVETKPRILGWDASGIVVSSGEGANKFKIGDEVYFIGDLRRPGANAQFVAVNEDIVCLKPKKLSFEEAASMPLTTCTAYESIADRLLISTKDQGKSLLIINSAGGVGSMASQIAKNFGLTVIGTASREESKEWTRNHGSDYVINHREPLEPQLEAIGHKMVDYILVNYDAYNYWDTLMEVIKPQGKICLIVDTSKPVDLRKLKDKSITLVSEMMSTRIKYDTEDKWRLGYFLQEAANMIDNGTLKHTLVRTLSPINAANLKEAHRIMEQQTSIGKIVISGF